MHITSAATTGEGGWEGAMNLFTLKGPRCGHCIKKWSKYAHKKKISHGALGGVMTPQTPPVGAPLPTDNLFES